MIITDFNRCKGCVHYTDTTRATSVCTEKVCKRVPYPASNLIKFTARDRFGSVEYRLDLRAITTMMNRAGQNQIVAEMRLTENPEKLLQCWLDYVEWLYEHEYEIMPRGIRNTVKLLRNYLIKVLEVCRENAGR